MATTPSYEDFLRKACISPEGKGKLEGFSVDDLLILSEEASLTEIGLCVLDRAKLSKALKLVKGPTQATTVAPAPAPACGGAAGGTKKDQKKECPFGENCHFLMNGTCRKSHSKADKEKAAKGKAAKVKAAKARAATEAKKASTKAVDGGPDETNDDCGVAAALADVTNAALSDPAELPRALDALAAAKAAKAAKEAKAVPEEALSAQINALVLENEGLTLQLSNAQQKAEPLEAKLAASLAENGKLNEELVRERETHKETQNTLAIAIAEMEKYQAQLANQDQ
jgi:hypothetical protein